MAIGVSDLERLLSYAVPLAAALLVVRLWSEKLVSSYPFFFVFLAWLVAEQPLAWIIPRRSEYYFQYFVLTDSVLWALQICVVFELFSRVAKHYPGIARSGRRFMFFALMCALFLSLGFAAVQHETARGSSPIVDGYFLIGRVIAFTLLAFLVLTLAMLFWFPIRLNRNVVIYAIGFSVYFSCRAMTRLARNLLGGQDYVLLSTISLSIVVVCLCFWIIMLSKQGEYTDLTIGHSWRPERGEALVQQLESINAALLRTARK